MYKLIEYFAYMKKDISHRMGILNMYLEKRFYRKPYKLFSGFRLCSTSFPSTRTIFGIATPIHRKAKLMFYYASSHIILGTLYTFFCRASIKVYFIINNVQPHNS